MTTIYIGGMFFYQGGWLIDPFVIVNGTTLLSVGKLIDFEPPAEAEITDMSGCKYEFADGAVRLITGYQD